jgi:excisionase family DNA binding protein
VTYQQAASYLGVSPAKVNWLIARKHLQGTRYVDGVTVGSVRKEKQWRATASTAQKTGRVIGDALSVIPAVLWEILKS